MVLATGERLAAWLEGLGLVDQLAAAGLPTLERDAAGRARWQDPVTGEPLNEAQLVDLDRLLHQQGSEPAHARPVALLQLRRQARLRAELLASPWFTHETLAPVRGTTPEATRFAVHKAAAEHRLLTAAVDVRTLVPAFQLGPDGLVRPELLPVLAALLGTGLDRWRVWAWLTQPAALLGGAVPHRAAADPTEAGTVLHAAVRLAERVRG